MNTNITYDESNTTALSIILGYNHLRENIYKYIDKFIYFLNFTAY